MPETEKEIARRSPARAIIVVYAILFLAFFDYPAGVTEWFADRCSEGGAIYRVLVDTVGGVESVSRYLGVAGFFERKREEAQPDLALEQD
jgi:hypothetical protein